MKSIQITENVISRWASHGLFLAVGKPRATWAEFKTQPFLLDFTAARGVKICKYYGLGEANTKTGFAKSPRTRKRNLKALYIF